MTKLILLDSLLQDITAGEIQIVTCLNTTQLELLDSLLKEFTAGPMFVRLNLKLWVLETPL